MNKNIAVFASGRGSNFLAIAKEIKKGKLKCSLLFLICDNPRAGVINKAKKMGIKVILESNETRIAEHIKREKINLIILAGFMRILSKEFIRKHQNRIINIHPSLLPSFKGKWGIKYAFDYGVRVTGVTVHFVDELIDHGPIILQDTVKINTNDTIHSLEERIHRIEHRIYPKAIKLFLEGKLSLKGRKVKISN
ncbi:MAG: phosphoribosylglycinamide formyltransferase [Candidatus Omnitrophota bacterium]|nr:phosphoribosylglycinamide formyltransferase [Candidatus Omnitrophota bacterium]MBU1929515.1 phosphoribosylglycinamide formyltransferase [Candidatus Omnitrophota bacterium]MBU2035312.1 phosphoribosylglycinamide formyltransferase [Candidatus Omnitrophota bacterium]MBU2258456.1 phosphoribosylglycinamide formyltransferase [Candidatus Omnitrophota bacterium]